MAGSYLCLVLRTELQTLLSLISSRTEESKRKFQETLKRQSFLLAGNSSWVEQPTQEYWQVSDSQGEVMPVSLVGFPAISLIDSSFTPVDLFHTTQYVAQHCIDAFSSN